MVDAAVRRVFRVHSAVLMDAENTTATSEAVVETAEVDCADAELAESGGTHNAGFDGNVEVGFGEDGGGMREEDVLDCNELGVTGALGVMLDGGRSSGNSRGPTQRERLVSFMPRPMMVPLCTKTQPTGTSSVRRASSAYRSC